MPGLPTITIPDYAGNPIVVTYARSGRQIDADSSAVALSAEDVVFLGRIANAVEAGISTAKVDNNGTTLTPKFAAIDVGTSGQNTLVAAVAGKKIRVLSYILMAAGAVNVRFRSAAASNLTGLKYFAAAGGGLVAPFNQLGWFETTVGEALTLNLSAPIAVGGELVYVEV
jgi:hypothetical protein